MKVFVQGKNMNVTRGIHQFVNRKVKQTIAKIGQRVVAVRVYIENVARKKNDPNGSKATVMLEIPGKDIVVKQKAHDTYLAIGEAIKGAGRQLRKLKDKRLTLSRKETEEDEQ